MHLICLMAVAVFAGLWGWHANAQIVNAPEKSILVGIEYFNGWWPHSPNKWEYQGKDWRKHYPGRIPVLGEYNSQETMDKEIKAAAEHGVDFFSILIYPGKSDETRDLNAGLDYFTKSTNSHRMKFMVELTNHQPFGIDTDEDWAKCREVCLKAMKHPSYLRIDGRAVLKIHGGDQFYKDCGSDIARCREVLQQWRTEAKALGVGELLIAVGTYGDGHIGSEHYFARIKEIDATMQYMDVPALPKKETDCPYEELAQWAKHIRNVRQKDTLNWVPFIPAGWSPRPWHDPRSSFLFPTREQWKRELEEVKSDLLNSRVLGFPKKDGTTQKAFTIYAWNEFGEGGIVAPTQAEQDMKLRVIQEVFGKE